MNLKAQAILARIEAEKAEVAGMEAENSMRIAQGCSIAYSCDLFAQSARILRDLANQLEALEATEERR